MNPHLPSSMPTLVALLVAGWLLSGCASSPAPGNVQVVDRNSRPAVTTGQYVVQRGDTLWSIAFRFGWDFRELARRNNIPAPYTIYPGQIIRFDGRASQAVASASSPSAASQRPTQNATPAASSPSVVVSTVPVSPPVKPVTTPAPVATTAPAQTPVSTTQARSASGWAWPASGTIIGRFSSNGSLNKGIDIAGELGQPVLAASDGTVVYAGSGLRGYGELVIIKHNDTYVSAYGHNRRLLVREGQRVKVGQTIAEMGSTGTDRVKLHFEIRRQGKPVDPQNYLPKR